MQDMDIGRHSQLLRLGFNKDQAAALSELHTKNFMLIQKKINTKYFIDSNLENDLNSLIHLTFVDFE